MKRTEEEVRTYYRDSNRAAAYVGDRFQQPLGALLHDRQVGHVVDSLNRTDARSVLEIAGGPARLTKDVAARGDWSGTMLDASAPMLREARKRLGEVDTDSWRFVHGNAFQLPFGEQFDMVYTFRLIRHFEAADRQRMYQEIRRVLKPGGTLIFDAVNEIVSKPLRDADPDGYPVYDALLHPEMIRDELAEAGFESCELRDVQRRYGALYKLQCLVAPRTRSLARLAMEIVDRFSGGEPLEWIVTCRRP